MSSDDSPPDAKRPFRFQLLSDIHLEHLIKLEPQPRSVTSPTDSNASSNNSKTPVNSNHSSHVTASTSTSRRSSKGGGGGGAAQSTPIAGSTSVASSSRRQTPSAADGEKYLAEFDCGDFFDIGDPAADNLMLLGDIGCVAMGDTRFSHLVDFLKTCAARFRRVFYVPGNHEAYGFTCSMKQSDDRLRALESVIPNFVFLNCDRYDVDGTDLRVLGCTLWSRCKPMARHVCNDFYQVRVGGAGSGRNVKFGVDEMHALHDEHVAWLLRECEKAQSESKRVIVLTHHAPVSKSFALAAEDHEHETMYGLNGSDLIGPLFSADKTPAVKLWAFGHTHWNFGEVVVAGGIRCATNQVGYPTNDETKTRKGYVPAQIDLVIEI